MTNEIQTQSKFCQLCMILEGNLGLIWIQQNNSWFSFQGKTWLISLAARGFSSAEPLFVSPSLFSLAVLSAKMLFSSSKTLPLKWAKSVLDFLFQLFLGCHLRQFRYFQKCQSMWGWNFWSTRQTTFTGNQNAIAKVLETVEPTIACFKL